MFTCGPPTQSRAPKRFATDTPRSSYAAASHPFCLPWEHLPLIAIANNAGSLPLLICAILITLLAICIYRTMTVTIVADITGMGVFMGLSVAGAKHGDAILIDEVVRREEAAEAE